MKQIIHATNAVRNLLLGIHLCKPNRQVDIMPNYPYPKIIAKFCFLVVLCEVGSTLQHTKSWTKLEYGKVSNFEDDFFRFTGHSHAIDLRVV